MDTLIVSAGVLIENGRVLLTQRKAGAHLEGLWEFPGGKVEAGEDPRAALSRELAEELGIDVEVADILDVTFHSYTDARRAVLLLFFHVHRLAHSPAPQPLDVAALRWACADEMRTEEFPPADVPVLSKVKSLLGYTSSI